MCLCVYRLYTPSTYISMRVQPIFYMKTYVFLVYVYLYILICSYVYVCDVLYYQYDSTNMFPLYILGIVSCVNRDRDR